MSLAKTGLSRPVISLLIIGVMAVAMFFAIVSHSDAQEQKVCPEGTTLSADGASCLSDAVNDNVVTTTSCTQGVLSDDGKFCIVPRTDDAGSGAGTPLTAPIPTFTG